MNRGSSSLGGPNRHQTAFSKPLCFVPGIHQTRPTATIRRRRDIIGAELSLIAQSLAIRSHVGA
jgi:hypothetical protein